MKVSMQNLGGGINFKVSQSQQETKKETYWIPQKLIQRQNHQHLRPNKNTNHAIAQLPPCPGLSETFTSNHWQLRLLKWAPKCFSTSVAMYWANSSAVVWTMGSKTQSSTGSTNFTLAHLAQKLAAEFSIHHLPLIRFHLEKHEGYLRTCGWTLWMGWWYDMQTIKLIWQTSTISYGPTISYKGLTRKKRRRC